MQNYHPNRSSGSYYRLIVLVALIVIFITVAMQSVWKMRVAAERTHVAWMVGSLQSAIGIEVSIRAVRGGLADIAKLDRSNPMLLLDNRPLAYLGEIDAPVPAEIAPRSWYFDLQTRELVYRVLLDDTFFTDLTDPPRIRFALRGHYTNEGTLAGINLIALDQYGWVEPE